MPKLIKLDRFYSDYLRPSCTIPRINAHKTRWAGYYISIYSICNSMIYIMYTTCIRFIVKIYQNILKLFDFYQNMWYIVYVDEIDNHQ